MAKKPGRPSKGDDALIDISVSLPRDVVLQLEELAEKDLRPRGQVARWCLVDGLERARKVGLKPKGRRHRTVRAPKVRGARSKRVAGLQRRRERDHEDESRSDRTADQ